MTIFPIIKTKTLEVPGKVAVLGVKDVDIITVYQKRKKTLCISSKIQ